MRRVKINLLKTSRVVHEINDGKIMTRVSQRLNVAITKIAFARTVRKSYRKHKAQYLEELEKKTRGRRHNAIFHIRSHTHTHTLTHTHHTACQMT